MQKCPNFIMNIRFPIFCQIFAKLFAKNMKGGQTSMYSLVCRAARAAEKKVQNSIFVRPALHGANIFQISFTICIIKQIFGEVFISHIQLVLNIFVTSFPFSDQSATGSFVNLLAYGPAIISHPNMSRSPKILNN